MALNFFDTEQLTRGAFEGEQHEKRVKSSHDSRPQPTESKRGSRLQIHVPELRKLHSDTTLRARAKGLNSPLSPRSPLSPQRYGSRPTTSGAVRQEKKAEWRPDTAQSRRTEASDDRAPRRKSFSRSLHNLTLQRPKSNTNLRKDRGAPSNPARPQSSGDGLKSGKTLKSKTRSGNDDGGEPRAERSRANTIRERATNILQQITNIAAAKPAPPLQPLPQPAQPLSQKQAQFLAESLAHVTVGEWLYKDHNRPSLVPRSNPFRRQTGPPSRGSTGLPQRRWFRISPYERKVMWSSRWDASSLDQLKTSRQVPINLVFETSANELFISCLPTHLIPFKRSIVIVAPQRFVKLTAPDETRHRMWLTALRYIADSTVKMDEEKWAAELRSQFEVLSAGDLSFPSDQEILAAGGLIPYPEALEKEPRQEHVSSHFFEEKPLPPNPPRSALSQSPSTPALTPPAVPRWKHGKQRAEGALEGGEHDFRLPSRGSDAEPVPAIGLLGRSGGFGGATSVRRVRSQEEEEEEEEGAAEEAEDEERTERAASTVRRSDDYVETKRGGEEDDDAGEGSSTKRDSRRLTSDDFAVDQMEMLVNRLGAI